MLEGWLFAAMGGAADRQLLPGVVPRGRSGFFLRIAGGPCFANLGK